MANMNDFSYLVDGLSPDKSERLFINDGILLFYCICIIILYEFHV